MKEELFYPSKDGLTTIHAIMWKPTTEIKAIVQISHGMVEHIARYETLASDLNRQGILVVGNDHLGHGSSVIDESHYGYFAKENSADIIVEDVHTLTMMIKEKYPGTPYILLGHSMGSFIARYYITKYSSDLSAAIIIGSSYKSKILMKISKLVTFITQLYHHGWFYRSPFLYKNTNGGFSKYFEEGNTSKHCWLTTDSTIISKYQNDPLSSFRFTCNGYYTLFTLIEKSCSTKLAKQIKPNFPILILSGKDDPVGKFGKDIYKIERQYKKVLPKTTAIKLYNGMRHELLNEQNRIFVINDIISFINKIKEN